MIALPPRECTPANQFDSTLFEWMLTIRPSHGPEVDRLICTVLAAVACPLPCCWEGEDEDDVEPAMVCRREE